MDMAANKSCWSTFKSLWKELSFAYFESRVVQSCMVLLGVCSMVTVVLDYDSSYSCSEQQRTIVLDTYFYVTRSLELFFTCLAVLDFFLALTFAPSHIGYCYSWMGVCDILSALPLFRLMALMDPQNESLDLFQFILSVFVFFRLSKVCRIGLFYKQLNLPTSTYYVIVLVDIIIIYVLICAAVLLGIDQFVTDAFSSPLCVWSNALYFTVSIISTVGFGDIVAVSSYIRTVIVFIILGALVLIPTLIANVMSMTLAEHSEHSQSLSVVPYDRWVCICGISPSASLLKDMLMELSTTPEERAFMVVILSPELPGHELAAVVNDIAYHARLRYYMGSAKNPADLRRIKAEWANAIYVVADLRCEVSLRNQEDSNYLTCIAVNAYLQKQYALSGKATKAASLPLADPISQLTNLSAYGGSKPVVIARLPYTAKTRRLLLAQGLVDVAVPVQEFQYGLLSYGIIYPGFLSLFTQLTYDPSTEDSPVFAGTSDGLGRTSFVPKQAGMRVGRRGALPRVLEISLLKDPASATSNMFMSGATPALSNEFLALTFEQVVCCLFAASKGAIVPIGALRASSASHRATDGLGRVFMNPVGGSSDGSSAQFSSELSTFHSLFVVSSLSRGAVMDCLLDFDPGAAARAKGRWGGHTKHAGGNRSMNTSVPSTAQDPVSTNTGNCGNPDRECCSPSASINISQATGSGLRRSFSVNSGLSAYGSLSALKSPPTLRRRHCSLRLRTSSITGNIESRNLIRSVCTPRRANTSFASPTPSPVLPCLMRTNTEPCTRTGAGAGADAGAGTSITRPKSRNLPDADWSVDISPSGKDQCPSLRSSLSSATSPGSGLLSGESFPHITILPQFPGLVPTAAPLSHSVDLGPVTSEDDGWEVGCEHSPDNRRTGSVHQRPMQSVPRFRGHVLLVIASSGLPLAARASLIPVVSVIRTLRREVDQQIVILTDKIPDLEVHVKEIEHASPGLLQDVLFVEGTSRHVEHIQACGVGECSVVLVLTPLGVAQGRGGIGVGAGVGAGYLSAGGGGLFTQALVEEDRPAVMAVLNILHALEVCSDGLDTVNGGPTTSPVRVGGGSKRPFVVVSIAHCSNALFLPLIPLPSGTVDYISTGGVLLHSAIEMCSCVHSVLSPSIVPLWEALLGLHSGRSGPELRYRRLGVVPHANPAPPQPHSAGNMDAGSSLSALDKICLPVEFEGSHFGDLFTALFDSCGVITVAICRYGEDCFADISVDPAMATPPADRGWSSRVLVPQVQVLPLPNTLLFTGDELFILQPLLSPEER